MFDQMPSQKSPGQFHQSSKSLCYLNPVDAHGSLETTFRYISRRTEKGQILEINKSTQAERGGKWLHDLSRSHQSDPL